MNLSIRYDQIRIVFPLNNIYFRSKYDDNDAKKDFSIIVSERFSGG